MRVDKNPSITLVMGQAQHVTIFSLLLNYCLMNYAAKIVLLFFRAIPFKMVREEGMTGEFILYVRRGGGLDHK